MSAVGATKDSCVCFTMNMESRVMWEEDLSIKSRGSLLQ
jgi:hypothetical protein